MNPLRPLTKLFQRLEKNGTGKAGSVLRLQQVIGYRFKAESTLKLALTHKSAIPYEDKKGLLSNERLEFLGDAVLNCLVTEHLFFMHPDKSEGQLSKIKSLIVSRKILGEVALTLSLGQYLILSPSEEKSGGRDRMSILSNAFEALLGAVYIDGGLEGAKNMLNKFVFPRIAEFLKDESNINFKSKILELAQKDGFGIPKYTTVESSGPDHAKQFRVRIDIAGLPLGEGIGKNKKDAQQSAAQNAIVHYNKESIISRTKGDKSNELFPD